MVTTLASNLAYTGLAGASGKITAMDFGNGDIYNASYDTGIRLTSASLTQASSNTLLYQTQPAYDAANNVVSVTISISGATDTQQFCYDSLNRLTWAGTSGTPPCSGVSFSAGTLTAAQYQQSDSYNIDGGLTSGPAGSYTYGDSSHPHAVTATSSGYSAAYDAAGNMICLAPSNNTTCSGTQTGQQLSYDAEGRLTSWQNQPSSPTSTANYLYDGSGQRVAMLTTTNGATTLTAYIGAIEEVQTTGSTTTTTTYYSVQGQRIAANVNGTFCYFGYDALGSQVVVLSGSNGAVIGSQLYGPYGSSRYNAGTLPTSISFTGQRTDSVTGLDYYGARYYDQAVGQFLSPDSAQGNAQGRDPYTYVEDNPETRTDPTGQRDVRQGQTLYFDDAGNAVSPPRMDFPEYNGSGLDPASYGADAVARDLAKQLLNDRRSKFQAKDPNARRNQDWANGEWYITDPDGNRIYGGDIGIEYSDPGGRHAEDKVLEKFLADIAPGAIEDLLNAYADGKIGSMLHIVVFTQYPPCGTCGNLVFPRFMEQLATLMNAELIENMLGSLNPITDGENPMGGVEDPLPVATLDVYGSTFVPNGPDWDHVFYPGTTDTYGVTDYWNDAINYTPTVGGFASGYGV